MKKLFAVLVFSLFLVGCSSDVTGIPWKFWLDANEPCEDGELYDYRGSTCPAPDLGSS